MRLLAEQFCVHCKPLAFTLFWVIAFQFLIRWMKFWPTQSERKFSFVLSKTYFLDKTGKTELFHGKELPLSSAVKACSGLPNNQAMHLSFPSKPRAHLFPSCWFFLFKTQLTQWLNLRNSSHMNWNNAVHMYVICQEFAWIQPMLLCYVKNKAQNLNAKFTIWLPSSNISNLHSLIRSLTECDLIIT